MTTDGVVKAAGFRRMNEENRWNVDSWNALRCLPSDVTERGADATESVQAPRPQVVQLFFGATSAPFHKGRLDEVWCENRL